MSLVQPVRQSHPDRRRTGARPTL